MGLAALALLTVELLMWLEARHPAHHAVTRLRGGMIVAAVAGATLVAVGTSAAWIGPVVLLFSLAEAAIGRWQFYEALHTRTLGG
jgi:hypothetical protein